MTLLDSKLWEWFRSHWDRERSKQTKNPEGFLHFLLLGLLGALRLSNTFFNHGSVFHQAHIATSKTGLARLILLIKSKTRLWCSWGGENNDSGIQAIGMVWIALGKRQWRFLTGSLLGFLAAVKLSNTLFKHCCLVHVLYRLLPVPTPPSTHYRIKKRTCATATYCSLQKGITGNMLSKKTLRCTKLNPMEK